jgi:predicted ATPase/class 3 adenylate cyclase
MQAGGAVFLFTDIEGSTARWEQDAPSMRVDLRRHDELLRLAIESRGGHVFKTVGDAFCAVFDCIEDALDAAVAAQRALSGERFVSGSPIRVRMAVHAGEAEERDADYYGPTLNRVARLLAIGHGGQVLLSGAVAQVVAGDVGLRDLGRHRLKDLAAPEHVFQLLADGLPSDFPPLRSLTVLENNLPQQTTSFVGRQEDITAIKDLLLRGRLVTLCGAGGVGKTRCSLQVAAEMVERFPDGVWFVDLAALSDGAFVDATIARIFDLQETPAQPALGVLLGHLRTKSLLLILDNCEHVIGAAAAAAAAILKNCPDVRLLCTSRAALNVAGENVHRLPSLSMASAVALFEERARIVNPQFEATGSDAPAIAEICGRLDGIPLAIELAVARLRVMTPAQLARKLDERLRLLTGGDRAALPRQKTMRALIDWSYDLLEERERHALQCLSVFSGGFTADAAANVSASDGMDEIDFLDVLDSLTDKSLISVESDCDGMRYRLLEMTREYAREKLERSGNAQTAFAAHALAYAEFAEALDERFEQTPPREWLREAEREIENLRGALTWSFGPSGDRAVGQRIAVLLPRIFGVLAPAEGMRWVHAALQSVDESTPLLVVAGIELAHASFASIFNQFSTALAAGQRAVHAFVELQHSGGLADAQRLVGRSLLYLGRVEEGERMLEESLAARRSLGSKRIAGTLGDLAVARALKGDLSGARTLFARASALFAQESDDSKIAITAATLAEAEFRAGNAKEALHLAEEALHAARGVGRHRTAAAILGNMAAYHLRLGDCEHAGAHAREAVEICRAVQPDDVSLIFALQHLAASALLNRSGDSADMRAKRVRAAQLLGFVDERLAELQLSREHTEQTTYDDALAVLREHFDSGELEHAFAAGRHWSEDRAISEAAAI